MADIVEQLTAETFDARLDAGRLHLIDFWADWCTPCHAMHPVLDAIAREYGGSVTVSKIDIHDHPEIGERYAISSLPTLIIFQAGEPVKRMSGVKRGPQLARELDALLG